MKSGSFSLDSVPVKQSPLECFSQFLQVRGKRVTSQRRVIVEQVFSHHDHFDAEELIGHLQPWMAQRKVSRPTVYRTLAELIEANLLRSMVLGGRTVYEHEYGYPRHDHLYCQICNKLIEFHSEQLERICEQAAKQVNFQVNGHRLFVSGVCADCQAARLGG